MTVGFKHRGVAQPGRVLRSGRRSRRFESSRPDQKQISRPFVSLDFSSLASVVQRLEEGLVRFSLDTSDVMIRDGLVQRFEFTYELSHKMLRRFLEAASANPAEFDEADFQYLIRTANEQSLLLGAWPQWRVYRDMRSKTRHTYDEEVALKVVAGIPIFLQEALFLLGQLGQRNAK
jgi:nucleotidyltransferase substrate binding protein (TIGR01987 family)